MIKSILIGLDDSLASKSALLVALEIAKITKATIKGLYVEDIARLLQWEVTSMAGVAIGASSGLPEPLPSEMQLEVEKEFLKESEKIKEEFEVNCKNENIKSSYLVLRGKVDELLINKSRVVDLLVLGRRGKTLPEILKEPGPVTESVTRQNIKPILVVPPEAKFRKKIMVAYDGSKSSQKALSYAAGLAVCLNASLFVVTVSNETLFLENCHGEAKEFLEPYELNVNCLSAIGNYKPYEGIIKEAKDFEIGIIVMGAYGENRLKELVFGSTTKEVIMKSSCPVLLCR